MKKILYSIIALSSLALSSCSNEDIEIQAVTGLHDLVVNLEPQQLYSKFQMEESFKNQLLRDKDLAIGFYALLYDSNGKLAGHSYVKATNYNPVNIEFKDVPEGTYTLATIQSSVDDDTDFENYEFYAFSLIGVEDLANLELKRGNSYVYWHSVVGVDYSTINLNSNKNITVGTTGIGSIIDVHFYDFDASSYDKVSFGTTDIFSTYRLDPSVSENNRVTIDLSQSGNFYTRCSIDVTSDYLHNTLYIMESEIEYGFYAQASDEGSTWHYFTKPESSKGKATLKSGSRYIGGIAYLGTNQATCILGTESQFDNWLKNISAASAPLIPNLYLTWGGTVKNVQSFMSGYTMTLGTSGIAVLQDDGSYMISYKGLSDSKVNTILYVFSAATTGLYDVETVYNASDASISALVSYFNNSSDYTYLTESDGEYYFASNDQKTAVMIIPVESLNYVVMMDMQYVLNQNNAPAKVKALRKAVAGNSPKNIRKIVSDNTEIAVGNTLLKESKKLLDNFQIK